jgi:hypothetical protein
MIDKVVKPPPSRLRRQTPMPASARPPRSPILGLLGLWGSLKIGIDNLKQQSYWNILYYRMLSCIELYLPFDVAVLRVV